MPLLALRPSARPQPVTSKFVTVNIGNTLILKACGFIEAHQARVVDVTEDSLSLRMGSTWLERRGAAASTHPPLEIRLDIRAGMEELDPSHRSHATSSLIEVTIRPQSLRWTEEGFQETSRRLLWLLRSHFLAC